MPNVALLFGAGLIGALFAGLFLLYSEDRNANFHSYNNNRTPPPPPPPPRSPPNNSFGSQSDFPNKRKKRTRKEDSACVICCDEIFSFNSHSLSCGHEFHIKCIQKWIKEKQQSPTSSPNCPTCRSVIVNPAKILNLPA